MGTLRARPVVIGQVSPLPVRRYGIGPDALVVLLNKESRVPWLPGFHIRLQKYRDKCRITESKSAQRNKIRQETSWPHSAIEKKMQMILWGHVKRHIPNFRWDGSRDPDRVREMRGQS